ncbi:unnamed protein product [Adineta ricciae]|uniref:Uncharacterized protein n=1 Tax=Adineta ricciae TaxID=249248 RepID=A0A816CY53_ADIRI|nr:unnamed protein product [Adineta ricciae]
MEKPELETSRIHGFTSWVNMRLLPYDKGLGNVLLDLMKGTNMKMLLQSVTGTTTEKIQSFEKLTTEQIRTRCEWAVKHLKEHQVIPEGVYVDSQLFAVRNAKHVFDLLWRLVEHDIWFLWERIDFLLQDDAKGLLEVPLKWIPTGQSTDIGKSARNRAILSGYDGSQTGRPDKYLGKFNETEAMVAFSKRNLTKRYPKPSICLIEIIQLVLQKRPEGRRINFTKLTELSDIRVMCSLINYFVPNLIPTEILLNDRWGLNLALAIIDDVLCCKSYLTSEDFVLVDEMAICSFMCYFFLVFFKYRQGEMAVRRADELRRKQYNASQKLRKLEEEGNTGMGKIQLEQDITQYNFDLTNLRKNYDLRSAAQWRDHVEQARSKVVSIIANKLQVRYDWFDVPVEATIADICRQKAVNLILTDGYAFYRILDGKQEIVTSERSFILIHKQTRQITVDKSLCKNDDDSLHPVIRKANIRSILEIGNINGNTEVKADRYPQYEDIARCCLDYGAEVNSLNKEGNTPLFCAAEKFSKSCAKLLLEYGADISVVNNRKKTVSEMCVNEEFQQTLITVSEFIASVIRALTQGDKEVLDRVITDHVEGRYTLSSLNSRFINGSTLLHTACYFNNLPAVQRLVKLDVNLDVRDFQGKTALHRTRDINIIKFLLECNADINATDAEGNTAIHAKCAGERNKPLELEAIRVLHEYGAELDRCNSKGETCFHLAARKGNTEVLQLLFELDETNMRESIQAIEQKPSEENISIVGLAIRSDHQDSAAWLLEHGFMFKQNEPDELIRDILSETITVAEPECLLQFLSKEGNATFSNAYEDGNSTLHLAAAMATIEPLKFLLSLGFDPDVVNQAKETPLFVATRINNIDAACILIEHGVDCRTKNDQGYTAFDYILDIDEWLASEKFDEETHARLRAYKYKSIRTLIYNVTAKLNQEVKHNEQTK